ncbi:hypothetical protein N302_01051, partial [Corvus brachyrhynchos]
ELEEWKATVGKYKENPDKVANLVERTINTQNPDWSDLKSMIETLLDPTERQMVKKAIIDSDRCGEIPIEVENAVNPIVWASDVPGRSKQAEPVSIALKPAKGLERAIPKTINWSALYAIKQGPSETPSEFLE